MKYVWVLLILDTYENTLTDVKVFDKPEYYQHFNPIGYFFFAFPFSLDFAKEMEQEKREKRKVRA